jgi:cytochrome d ubiquinol oxidase subunit I
VTALVDPVALARIQFAVTVAYHFLFVPLSIGIGLVMVMAERQAYKDPTPENKAASKFWIKIFTATFAIGVATGITMEFSFGTNWANYSRFVGDIFGAPLAAEALFAFFLESTFLGVLLFGRNRVSPKFYYVSAWLVWAGSMLSALWIIIANSWMQTPAGYKIVETSAGRKAELTNFFAAALNPSTLPRYFHTVDSVLITGGFIAAAIGAWYYRKGRDAAFAKSSITIGLGIALITSIIMLPLGHWQAVSVVDNQPEKAAAMEGHWDTGPMDLGIIGWVNVDQGTTTSLAIPGGVSFLASGTFTKEFPGLNDFKPADLPPIQPVYQSYRIMILLYGAMLLLVAWAWWLNRKGTLPNHKGLLGLLVFAPLLPEIAIQAGWFTAEVGRQPWIVYQEMRTLDGISLAVPAGQIALTLTLFVLFYSLLFVAWARIVLGIVATGPQVEGATRSGTEPEQPFLPDEPAAANL